MKTHRWQEVRRKNLTPEQIAQNDKWVQAESTAIQLRELRELSGHTQAEVAEILETTQGHLSTLEKREDHKLSTLRKYVEALGGELQVVATFGDRSIRLKGV